LGFRVHGLEFTGWDFGVGVKGAECGVMNFRFGILSLGCSIKGSGFRVWI
jgi:hypothetical protein